MGVITTHNRDGKLQSNSAISLMASDAHPNTRSSGSLLDSRQTPQPSPHNSKKSLGPYHSRNLSGIHDSSLDMRKSKVSSTMVEEVKKGLTEAELKEVDLKMINQFLRATKLDVARATKRLKATVVWRLQETPHLRCCSKCLQKPRSHYLHMIGFTKMDQPVLYSCFAMGKDKDVAANREHMLTTFEQAIRAMPPHVEQWVWLCDYHGFGLKDCDPRLAKAFLDISEKHYPERLAAFVNISTPAIFPMFFRAIENWIDPYTRSKIKFLNFNPKPEHKQNVQFKEELGKILEPDMLDWLMKEMAQNRTKDAVKQKDYPYGKRYPGAETSDKVVFNGHDCRGHPDLITVIEADPNILVPKNLQDA